MSGERAKTKFRLSKKPISLPSALKAPKNTTAKIQVSSDWGWRSSSSGRLYFSFRLSPAPFLPPYPFIRPGLLFLFPATPLSDSEHSSYSNSEIHMAHAEVVRAQTPLAPVGGKRARAGWFLASASIFGHAVNFCATIPTTTLLVVA